MCSGQCRGLAKQFQHSFQPPAPPEWKVQSTATTLSSFSPSDRAELGGILEHEACKWIGVAGGVFNGVLMPMLQSAAMVRFESIKVRAMERGRARGSKKKTMARERVRRRYRCVGKKRRFGVSETHSQREDIKID